MFGTKSLRVNDPASIGWYAHTAVDDRFHGLVERLKIESVERPKAYRRRVILAAFIGYAFLLSIIIALLAIVVLSVGAIFFARSGAVLELKIAIVCGLVAIALLRSMAVSSGKPDGIRITAEEAPRLFALVERIRQQVGSSAIDEIYITDELNASMAQPARFWLFGVRNVLSLGFPMLHALSEEELASVIAHELGHSVGSHGRWAGFIYRVRIRWMQVADRLQSGFVAGLLRRFFSWYGPWFNAYSFVLARNQEYEADQVAARVASLAAAGSALVRIELQSNRFGNHWGRVWSESRSADRPSAMPYATVAAALQAEDDGDQAVLSRALAVSTGLDDTHPCLSDRLSALPARVEIPSPVQQTAAASLLGPYAEELATRFDSQWWSDNGDWWQTLHEQAKAEAEEYQRLKETIEAGGAPFRDHLRLIDLAANVEGDEAAIAARRRTLEVYPWAHTVRFYLGTTLLAVGQDEGIEHVETAISHGPSLGPVGYRAIVEYLNGAEDGRAGHYQELLEQSEAIEPLASEEGNTIDQKAELLPLSLDPSERAELAWSLKDIAGLTRIIAAERVLKHGGRQIIFVFTNEAGASAHEVLDRIIQVMLDFADVLGLERTKANSWLARMIEPLDGSLLIDRTQTS